MVSPTAQHASDEDEQEGIVSHGGAKGMMEA